MRFPQAAARSVVAFRLVNGFSWGDVMLSMSRPLATSKGGLHDKYAGQQAVPHKLVENVDLGK